MAEPFKGKLILTVGLPGSGKSTWARGYQKTAGRPVMIVERDEIRTAIGFSCRDFTQEARVTRIARDMVGNGLADGLIVVVSDLNIKPRYRNEWMGFAGERGASIEIKSFLDVPLDVCIARDAERSDPDVIRGMYKYLLDSGQVGPVRSAL